MNKLENRYSKTTCLAFCGLFAALNAICAFITIPLGFTPIPMNLGTLGVFLTGALLGRKYGSVSICVYLLMGAVGVPVFAGFQGGIGVILGPNGGFLAGYLVAVLIIGVITQRRNGLYIPAMVLGLAACYVLGTLWFMFVTGTSLVPALAACVVPFILPDVIKILAAYMLVRRLRPILYK